MPQRLGSCSYPNLTQAAEGNVTQDYCEEIGGGNWTPNVPPIDPGGGGGGLCAVRTILCRALAENIMQLGTSYHLTYLFRDHILYKSSIGKRLVKQYYTYAEELYTIVVSDPDILGGSIRAWGTLYPFIAAMLACVEGVSTPNPEGKYRKMRFTKVQYAMASKLIRNFSGATENSALRAVLKDIDGLLREYVGLTPPEALAKLTNSRARTKRH